MIVVACTKMKKDAPSGSSAKRDDIVQHAYEIFYREGFHAAGVDLVLKGSGISKRTLYKHFSSKEALIQAALEHYHQTAYENISGYLEKKPSLNATEKILRLFDWLEEVIKSGDKNGCFSMNAASEYANRNAAIEKTCAAYLSAFENLVTGLCKQANSPDPKTLARQMVILFRGAIANTQVEKNTASIKAAKTAAKVLLGK